MMVGKKVISKEWWCHITGYERSSGLYPFEWIKDHPLPFEEIRIGYSEEPEKLLAVIGTKVWAYDWGTTTFKPEDLTYTKEKSYGIIDILFRTRYSYR